MIASKKDIKDLWHDLYYRTGAWQVVRRGHGCWETFYHDASVAWDRANMVFLMSDTKVVAYDPVDGAVCPILFYRYGMSLLARKYLKRWNWWLWKARLKLSITRLLAIHHRSEDL